jgi:hypothetical protein
MNLFVYSTFLAVALSAFGQQQSPTIEAQSSGQCSPNILSNQGKVQFTCNAPMDATTATKIVSLLNQILQKESGATNPTGDINNKLDEILAFVRTQGQESQRLAAGVQELQQQIKQRHLSESQKAKLASLLRADSPQEFYFLCAPDAETTYFSNEILNVLESAGWKAVPHPPNWGTIERSGVGVLILVHDVTQPVSRGAIVLQQALKEIGIEAPGSNFLMAPNDKITLYVGVRPESPGQ